ncbi:hypothetical protein PIB30_084153 [Stylosanthes scabra]|uniref:Uncharacterized protein n=1 Tax=Stylosanthes scabra TaxID=79078 RepID=A0ABU6ZR32_9FABA|nr:hypothetical protein [Stylosanthes scabra]
MGNRIIYYEIEKCERYEDSDESENPDLAVVKTRRYHFDDEPFIHPLHSIRFDPDRPYELPVESLLALRCRDPSKKKDSAPQESDPSRRASPTPQYSPLGHVIRLGSPSSPSKMVPPTQSQQDQEGVRPLTSWEFLLPSEGWMCEGDEVEGLATSSWSDTPVDLTEVVNLREQVHNLTQSLQNRGQKLQQQRDEVLTLKNMFV